jgi:hypothetical protein
VQKKTYHALYAAFFTLVTFTALFILRRFDDNTLTSWRLVFSDINASKVFLILIAGVFSAYLFSTASFYEKRPAFSLFIFSYTVSMIFWGEPEVIMDSSRYFTQAKHLEVYGAGYFLREWGRGIYAWTDMPLLPFIYGLIFRFLGEQRIFIQAFTTLLFSMTVMLTFLIGRRLRDEETGFYAGLLMLGMPYLFTQAPLMLVDVPTMFFFTLSIYAFIRAMEKWSIWTAFLACVSVFLAFFSKYSIWIMLPPSLAVVFFVYLKKGPRAPGEEANGWRPGIIVRSAAIALFSGILIIAVVFLKYDVISGQISLLKGYQLPGLKRWEEGLISTFFFQINPLITALAVFSIYVSIKRRDITYLIIGFVLPLMVLMKIRRIRYIMMAFPMLALMGSYGLQAAADKESRKYIALCIVCFSLVVSIFAFFPYLRLTSEENLKNAGDFINSLDVEDVEVVTLIGKDMAVNPAVSVPILDLFTNKRIIYRYENASSFRPEDALTSPFRFTWEYKNPRYYEEKTPVSGEKTVIAVISSVPDEPLPESIKEKLKSYKISRVFDISGPFRYKTIVSIYRYRGAGNE